MLKAIEKKINLQLEGLHYYLHHYRKFSKDLPWKFILRITVSGYKYYDFKFSLKQNEILKLLIGEGLYERKEESIRELLKNCVDTCRLNSIKLKKEGSDDSYHPRIFFELTPSRDKLSVSDNGIGMDEYIIDNYFTKIGKSFYRSPDFLEENYNFSPLSELGIGFLSSFLIADEVNIETKTIESDPLEMDIDDISDYFLVKSGNQRHHGTKITLHLKDEVKEIFLKEELEHFARHIEIPITVVMASGERHIIGPRSDFKAYFRTGDLNSRLYMWSRKLECELFKGMIGILFEKEGERKKLASIRMHSDDCSVIYDKLYINQERFNPTFVDKAKGRLHIINPVINAVISCNGILVCIDRVIPKWLDDGSFFQDINIDKNSLDLSLSRDSIISNEKFEKISRLLEEKVIECFVALLEGLEFEDAKERNLFILAMCSRDYISEIDDEKYITSFRRYHEPLLNFFIKFYSFKCFTKEDANLKSYKEIINSKREIRLLDYIKNNNNEYIHQMLIKCDKLNSSNMYIMLEDHDLIRLLIMHSLNCFEINKLL
jgi:HSP90 family molecular chaperone